MPVTATRPQHINRALLLVLIFLISDVLSPQLFPAAELDDAKEPRMATSTWSWNSTIDTMIQEQMPTSTHGNDTTVDIGKNGMFESRMLLEFGLNLSGQNVHSATLDLDCWNDDGEEASFQVSNITEQFNESNANWINRNTSLFWDEMGAESSKDRSDWEPSVKVTSNGTVSLNVTRMVQQRALNGWLSMRFLVSATDSYYTCITSEHSNSTRHPSLSVVFDNGTVHPVGEISPDWVVDGESVMTGDFILNADSTPTMEWTGLNGTAVQIQISGSSKFRMDSDFGQTWDSMANASTFTLAANGSMVIPASEAIDNGSTVHYRMRAINNNQIGEWQNGWFNLPGHDIVDNGDGTATISIRSSDLGLAVKTIQDVELDDSQSTSALGSEETMKVGTDTSPNQESRGLIRLNMAHIGMHSNATILSSTLKLTRSSYNGMDDVSLHLATNHEDWVEDSATWSSPTGTATSWNQVIGSVQDAIEVDQTSATFAFNTTVEHQSWFLSPKGLHSDLLLLSKTPEGSYSSSNDITFHSTEATSTSNQPLLEITYEWGASVPTSEVDMTFPLEGEAVWNISVNNLSGNTTPDLIWNSSGSSGHDIVYQLSDDRYFRNVLKQVDTRTDTDFSPSDGSFSIVSSDGLSTGAMYYWRMTQVDSNSRWSEWNEQSFFITDLTSDWLGGDRHQFRLRDGNASTDGMHPDCKDTYIDSGAPTDNYDTEQEMQVAYNTIWGGAETSILFGCQLLTHLLPTGYAVTEAKLRYKLAYTSGNPYVGAYESHQHNWTEEGATWNSYDGINSWGSSGAKGWERGPLLASNTITSSSGSWLEWNVTLGVQNAMREGRNFDVIMAILGAGSGGDREALLYGNSNGASSRAELVFTYVPGSSALPDTPLPISPANGSWSVEDGIEPAPEQRPLLKWNYTSSTAVSGYVVDLDTNTSFESADLLSYGSWSTSGFDLSNMTFQVPIDLDVGETWYWRVRGVSSTNQIGNWSQANHFLIPDLVTWSIDSQTAAVELHHQQAMSSLGVPHFIDTWIADSGSEYNTSHATDEELEVGERSDGSVARALMKIPLTDLPMPQNATLKEATLNLYPEWGSSTNQRISVHALNTTWNESATGLTRNGQVNWSSSGGAGSSDMNGDFVDIQDITPTTWVSFDVTEIAQSAHSSGALHIEFILEGDADQGQVYFSSVESSSDRPWVNLTWTTGQQSPAEVAATTIAPVNGEILWNNSGIALLPSGSPTFEWQHANASNIDGWRLFISNDWNDPRDGWVIHDSRSVSGFDLTNLEFTPSSNLSNGDSYRWFVQAVDDDVLGQRSAISTFHLPLQSSEAINSTDAYGEFQDGLMIPATSYPDLFKDTWLDGFNPSARHGANTSLVIGDSPHNPSSPAHTLIEFNLSSMPIHSPYEVVAAEISLYKIGGSSSETVNISLSPLLVDWSESHSSWLSRTSNASWQSSGATGALDSGIPIDSVETSDGGWYSWDISHALQQAHMAGHDTVRFLLKGEGAVSEWHEFASSEYILDSSYRPAVNVTWRSGNAWAPSDPSGQGPGHMQALWNMSAPRPSPPEELAVNWSTGDSNVSSWEVQFSSNSRFHGGNILTYDSSDPSSYDGTFDLTNLSYTLGVTMSEDEWIWWRVRAIQGSRIGNWTTPISFRIPDAQGSDDGSGNHSLTLYRGSIFSETGDLPSVPDGWVDSSLTSANHGSSSNLTLGLSHGGNGVSSAIIEFDLNEMPFPANMTPTQVLLRLYRNAMMGGSSLTISAHACDSFSESNLMFSNAPTCNSTEVARSTLGIIPPQGWFEWDITSLAQSNALAGNRTLTVMLTPVGTTSTTMFFHSSEYFNESLRPQLVLDYVDNSEGIVPPAQPSLISPLDGSVLYQESNWLLSPDTNPEFDWNDVPNATGYIFTLLDSSGQTKYRSWEDSGFNGSYFTLPDPLSAGGDFQWWVQAINGSIPGPSSSRWSFGIGNPVNHTANGDLTWTYQVRHGDEVTQFGHPDVQDGWIGNLSPDDSHGDEDLIVGSKCGGSTALYHHQCIGMISIDVSDLPLPADARAHSASVQFSVSFLDIYAGATSLQLSIHPLWSQDFNPQASNWSHASAGNPWAAQGLLAGVDYGPATDSITLDLTSMGTSFWLDMTHSGLDLTTANGFVLIVTTTTGNGYVELVSSESMIEDDRPTILFNYTSVDSVSITPGNGVNTDADTTVDFDHGLYDANGTSLSQQVVWSSEDGSIDSTGIFTPNKVGIWNISACFGAVCETIQILVNPGAGVLHQVSVSNAQITADETLDIDVVVHDQHGNNVPGETITWQVSNGSLNSITPSTGWGEAMSYSPWTAGAQSVKVSWNGVDITIDINVLTGVPSYFVLIPCGQYVLAGEQCQFNTTLHDAKDNLLETSEAGNITWHLENGNITPEGLFSADKVGTWFVNISSASGASASSLIIVGHGAIDHLRVDISNESITADEIIWLNTTRVDIQGNELAMELPASAWEVQSGTLINGTTATWEPVEVGNRWIKATLEGKTTTVYINVAHGVMVDMSVIRTQSRNGQDVEMTSDDMTTDETDKVILRAWGIDAKGNRWSIEATWSLSAGEAFAQICETRTATSCWFEADVAMPTPYQVRATYAPVESTEFFTKLIDFQVSHGELASMEFTTEDGEQQAEMTVDDSLELDLILRDADGNEISNDDVVLTCQRSQSTSTEFWESDCSEVLFSAGLEWTPGMTNVEPIGADDQARYVSDREDDYSITATIQDLEETIAISLDHGVPVRFEIGDNSGENMDDETIAAGNSFTRAIHAFDKAGNIFETGVDWDGQYDGGDSWIYPGIGKVTETGNGEYTFTLFKTTQDSIWEMTSSPHMLRFSHPLVLDAGQMNVTVTPSDLGRLELELLQTEVEQLGTVELYIKAFDIHGNEIIVPSSIDVSASGRGEVSMVEGNFSHWSIKTLDDGEQSVSIEDTNGSGYTLSETASYTVTGNIAGFFESGGTMYYVGAGLGIFVMAALGIVVFILIRRSGSEYDEYDDDEDEDYYEESESAPGPEAPPQQQQEYDQGGYDQGGYTQPGFDQPAYDQGGYEEASGQDDSYRVDENGTEWWQDEVGTWWYRAAGEADWSEWRD